MSSGDAFKFPKLSGQNYVSWSVHMQSILQSKYLWLVVKGTETCPPGPDIAPTVTIPDKAHIRDHLDWVSRDEAAQGLMRGATDETQWPHIVNCTTSKEMWDSWKQVHQENQQKINMHYYFEELYTQKYMDSMPMADHIATILDIQNQIAQAGEQIS